MEEAEGYASSDALDRDVHRSKDGVEAEGEGRDAGMVPLNGSLEALRVQEDLASTYGPKRRDYAITIRSTGRALRQALREDQVEMTRDAAPYFQEQDLPQRWMSATPEKRGEHILAGLTWLDAVPVAPVVRFPSTGDGRRATVRARGIPVKTTAVPVTGTANSPNHARHFCEKEMDVESHRRDDQFFLSLMQEIMVQNPAATALETPIYISHPVWDALAAEEQASSDNRLALMVILAERNMLISFVTMFTYRSFLDFSTPELKSTKGSHKPVKGNSSVSRPMQDALRVLYGEEAVKGVVKATRENANAEHIQRKEEHANGKPVCQTCKKSHRTTHAANDVGIQ
ncbi:hypothetical protein FB45DRAFT_1065222 [Roridomyces roridus]|uniref:Uncharacterized protein n=1 Tax=Roridomyces roridus TaxID=1738132 RepID=A0AAD7B882_9AGAR|nr:hypothetical protein FB45DRAFT_1065222 [Roridomyces roridus]